MISNKETIRTSVEDLFLREMVQEDVIYLVNGEQDDTAFDIMVPDTEELIEGGGLFDNTPDYSSELNADEFDDIYFNKYGL